MKTDRRTKYTKMVIKQAFSELIRQKPIEKITVSDICSLAEISRPTFYFHYQDIYALLDETGDEMLASAKLDDITRLTIANQDEIFQVILNLVHIIEENADVYRICVLERGMTSRLSNRISEALDKTIIAKWRKDGKMGDSLYSEYFLSYMQSGFNSVIYCWMNRKENRESAEEIAAIIKTFLLNGLTGFVK